MSSLILASRDVGIRSKFIELGSRLGFSVKTAFQSQELVQTCQGERDYALVCDPLVFEGLGIASLKEVFLGATRGVIIVSNKANSENLKYLGLYPEVNHILVSTNSFTQLELEVLLKKIFNSTKKKSLDFTDQVLPKNLNVINLSSSSQIKEKIKTLEEEVKSLELGSNFTKIASSVATELLMNHFVHSEIEESKPKSQTSKIKNKKLKDLDLPQGQSIDLRYGVDDGYFWIVTSDRFGLLSREAVIGSLFRNAQSDFGSVRLGTGGAGIGLFMIYNKVSEIIFQVEKGLETLTASRILISKRNRDLDLQKATVHFFVK